MPGERVEAHGMKWGSGFFVRLNHAARLSASLLCLRHIPATPSALPCRLGVDEEWRAVFLWVRIWWGWWVSVLEEV